MVLTLRGRVLTPFRREPSGVYLEGQGADTLQEGNPVVFTLRGRVLTPFRREPSGVYLEGQGADTLQEGTQWCLP